MIWPLRRKSRRRMARIVVDGPITGATRQRVLKALREVKQREFPALLLRIDSPGGTVGDSQEIHAALMRLRESGCRVVASFGNISASGGVYIGVAAEKIVSNAGTITGSIGVILRGNDLSRVFESLAQQEAAHLSHRLQQQDARHDRRPGVVPLEERLVHGHVLDANGSLVPIHLDHAIHQEHRVARTTCGPRRR